MATSAVTQSKQAWRFYARRTRFGLICVADCSSPETPCKKGGGGGGVTHHTAGGGGQLSKLQKLQNELKLLKLKKQLAALQGGGR